NILALSAYFFARAEHVPHTLLTRKLRFLTALCAALALAVGFAACGGIPGNSIAKVSSQLITFKEFKHWVEIAGRSQGQQTGGTSTVPDAPSFVRCIANKRKTLPKPPAGQKPPTDSQLKQECQTEHDGIKTQAEA